MAMGSPEHNENHQQKAKSMSSSSMSLLLCWSAQSNVSAESKALILLLSSFLLSVVFIRIVISGIAHQFGFYFLQQVSVCVPEREVVADPMLHNIIHLGALLLYPS
jgi:hypothetical protein